MNIIRISIKNVILIFLAALLTTVKQVSMAYESMVNNMMKEVNVNSTPAYSSKNEETSGLCQSGTLCLKLSGECLNCNLNPNCVYGTVYITNCTVIDQINCIGKRNFQREYICRYCYQTEHWEHYCQQKNSCSSVASPRQYYRTNCTVNRDILCLGRRKFMKNLPCNWTVGYRWSTALILSITLGGFGADRFYLGHWHDGIGKLLSFGGFGVWTVVDVILISVRYLGPADGSLYI
ncbi:TM2 domain-containing protein almondex-like isoform X1 [Augochlora pura]